MKTTWKSIKDEIDSLPTTEKTVALKKKAREFSKELREKLEEAKQLESPPNFFPNKWTGIAIAIKGILGET